MFAIESHPRGSITNFRSLSDSDLFYCDKRSTAICIVLGPEKSSRYSSEYTSGFSGPVALRLAASPSSRYEGHIGQAPRLAEIL